MYGDVVSIFERQVAATPEAVAITAADGELTYSELNARANRLARFLVGQGIGPEARVALCFGRTTEWAVAIFAVWKAGGAYAAIEPTLPTERVGALLEDLAPHRVLAGAAQLDLLTGAEPVLIEAALSAEDDDTDLGRIIDPHQLAYLIYTSGSTGLPKAVQIEHGSLAQVIAARSTLQFQAAGPEPRRVALTASFSFDAALLELCWLLRGDCVWISDEHSRRDTRALVRELRDRRIQIFFATPSQLSLIVTLGAFDTGDPPVLVIIGGEAIDGALWRILRSLGPTRFFNEYGPAEATIYVTAQEIGAADTDLPTIGRPLPGVRLHLLGADGRPVADGAVGECWIGGANVGRGYWRRPELTEQRFVADPEFAGDRAYRTGDLLRRRPDGLLDFVGRADDQISLRGIRIEPGEIVDELTRHPEISAAAVTVSSGPAKSLVAYVVPVRRLDRAASDEQVRRWREVFETLHLDPSAEGSRFELEGWLSSYSGLPIPEPQMRQWVDLTVAQISSLRPRKILEIGVGSGLLLRRLAPGCEQYLGIDYSATTATVLAEQLGKDPIPGARVLHCEANKLDPSWGLFDCVILNSVTQFFPNESYLADVLTRALGRLRPGGHLFLGDVRDLELAPEFHRSVVAVRHPEATEAEASRLVEDRLHDETELLVSRQWITDFAAAHGVEVSAIGSKNVRQHNELTKFRFDAVLTRGVEDHITPQPLSPDGDTRNANTPRLRSRSERDIVESLRLQVAKRLPEYMRPAQYVVLDQLPLTRDGKLDRDALPDPATRRTSEQAAGSPPSTQTEITIAKVWSDVLGVASIHLEDHFFHHLGGDSLSAARMLTRLRDELGTDLSVRQVLATPTLGGLATSIDDILLAQLHPDEITRILTENNLS